MIAQPENRTLSPQEYLAWEATSETKHEYYQGEIYAMAGASNSHVLILMNLITLFRSQLRGSNCRVYAADTKVFIPNPTAYFYPDLAVSCHASDLARYDGLEYPSLIIEVLSPQTETYDRGRKFITYQTLNSLQDYLLISQTEIRVEHYHRQAPNQWLLTTYHAGDTLNMPGLVFSCGINDLYEDVNLG